MVDATFRRAEDRAAFVTGLETLPASAMLVECRAPVSVRTYRALEDVLDDLAVVLDARLPRMAP